MEVRLATKRDIPWIIHHRIEMFRSMGYTEEDLKDAEMELAEFLKNDWDDSIICFLIIEKQKVVGGCAVSIYSKLPNPRNPKAAKVACVHNMFVEPAYRNQGKATSLMKEILSHLRKRGVYKVTLHDTDMSHSIYKKLGFRKVENYYDLWMKSDG